MQMPDPVPELTGESTDVGPEGADVEVGDVVMSVPEGAVPGGHTFAVPVVAEIPAQPGEIFGRPVGLDDDVPLVQPVTVRWSLPALDDVQRASLTLAKWDEAAHAWAPRTDVPFQLDGDTLIAELTEFSCCWDGVANAGQTIREVVGARRTARSAAAPPCPAGCARSSTPARARTPRRFVCALNLTAATRYSRPGC